MLIGFLLTSFLSLSASPTPGPSSQSADLSSELSLLQDNLSLFAAAVRSSDFHSPLFFPKSILYTKELSDVAKNATAPPYEKATNSRKALGYYSSNAIGNYKD